MKTFREKEKLLEKGPFFPYDVSSIFTKTDFFFQIETFQSLSYDNV